MFKGTTLKKVTIILFTLVFILLPTFTEQQTLGAPSVSIDSIKISPPLVCKDDTIDVDVKILVKAKTPDTRILATINAPGFAVLIGNQSKIVYYSDWSYYTDLHLKLIATKEGEYTATIKLYILNVSIPIEVDSRSITIRVLGRAKLEIKVYDIIFHIPVDDAEVLAVPKEHPDFFVRLYRVSQGNIYETSLPKAVYDIVVNNQNVTKLLLLNEDKSITVEAFSNISITILIILAITSAILPFVLESFTNNENWFGVGILYSVLVFIIGIIALSYGTGRPFDPYGILILFIFFIVIDILLLLYILIIKIKERLSYSRWRSYQKKKSKDDTKLYY